jgi:cyclophilin family peptidyl-prolyl cis-trans isomerase/cbb3-type cytochrome oxidase subunit 3
MTSQQTKRRRKRYQAASSYAGDVKPAGVLGLLGSTRTIQVVFIVMALALVAGVVVGIFTQGQAGQDDQENRQGFVLPDDAQDEGTPGAPTPEVKEYDSAPAMTIDTSKSYTATLKTSDGDIQIELLPEQAPQTVNNFVFLAKDGFYDGLIFHYVQQDFEAITGDPFCTADSTTDCRGRGGPGYELDEGVTGEYDAGTVGMANGSQFFIALVPSDQFSDFTPFGRITSGLEVARQLTTTSTIESVTIQEG